MMKKGLFVKLVAKPGEEAQLEAFLNRGLALVYEEPLTRTWYALKFNDSTYGIFDSFDDDEGRNEHLTGRIAEALGENADKLLASPPSIEKVDILASK